MKVSYQKQWGADGTVYRQTIRISMSRKSLELLNDWAVNFARKFKHGDTFYGHLVEPNNIKKPLFEGKNYLKLSQFWALYYLYELQDNKRVKTDRNTILLIEIE